jgi:hypothetical protein
MPYSHDSPHSKLTDEQHQLIGMFVTEWATCEFYLGILLGRLLLAPEFLARTFTDRLNAAAVQDAIEQAVEIHRYRYGAELVSVETLEEIRTVNRKIEHLRSTRNKFAHYCWSRSSDDKMFGTNFSGAVPTDKRHKRSFAVMEVAQVRQQYEELFATVENVRSILEKIPEACEESAIKAFRSSINGA